MTSGADPHLAAGAYVLHALPPDEEAAFERHMDGCRACRREVAELAEAVSDLSLAEAETAAVPARLHQRVLREIDRIEQERSPAAHLPPGRRHKLLSWALAASLVVAAALGGVAAWQYSRAQDARAQAAALQSGSDTLTRVLTAPDATLHTGDITGGGAAAVVISRADNQAAFLATGLPALSAGKVYELWYAAPSGDLRPAGLLPGTGGRPARVLDRPVDGAVAVGLTVEPAGGSEQPTTEPLGIIQVGT
ncbi:anti-sigma factor [Streptomyces actuosus]|uniref:Regulator of SigK n=1 Tax=Streptomyces actuosus TaxID=1885 RepID=A0ABS2VHM8_STRAS|nr:anti-sigma factor [Streptomyces actuosus]MBN0042576.1 anti-sigma factor [Streptomyces actuosus]